MGISKAKKVGIDNARGKYLTFIDGDDWFERDALKEMITAAEKFDTDMVLMNHSRRYPLEYKKNVIMQSIYNTLIPAEEIISDYYISFFGINKINVAYWGKLIRTEIVRKSKFTYNDIPVGEDLLFNAHIFPLLKSMVFIDYYGYNWRFGGITSSKNTTIEKARQTLLHFIEVYRIKRQLAQDNNFERAFHPMFVELKNILRSLFASVAKYEGTDSRSNPVKQMIGEMLKINDYCDNITLLLKEKRHAGDAFITAVSKQDVETVYSICHDIYRKNWKKRLLKQMLHKFNVFTT